MVEYSNKDKAFEILSLIIYIAIIVVLGFFALFVEGGVTRAGELLKNSFYGWGIALSLGLISVLWFGSIIFKKSKVFEDVFIDNPNKSIIPFLKTSSFWRSRTNRLFTFIILFMTVGLIGAFNNTFFANFTQEQQISVFGDFLLSAFPQAGAETLLLISIFMILRVINNLFVIFKVYGKTTETIINFPVIPILTSLAWMGIHIARYGSQETSLLIVLLFGFLGSTLITITGSVFSYIIWHDVNNLFFKANSLFSNETILISTIIIYIIVIVSWLSFIAFKSNTKNVQIT